MCIRDSHVVEAHRAADQIPQTEPYRSHVVDGLVPGVAQGAQGPGLPELPHHDPPLQALLAALVGEGTVGQVQSAQIEPSAVPEHLDGHILPRPAQEKNRIALEIDAVPVDAVDVYKRQCFWWRMSRSFLIRKHYRSWS